MKQLLIIAIIFLFVSFSSAQNLVPNWSFEQYDTCPSPPINFAVSNWFNPSVFPSTPDYYFLCGGWYPNGGMGYQLAHYGDSYVGISAWGKNGYDREYIGVELSDTLKGNKDYFVSFYVSLTEMSGYAINSLGAHLSDSLIFIPLASNFPYAPQVQNPSNIYLSSDSNWMKIGGIYSAHGGEKFLIIGNLNSDSLTSFQYIDTTQFQLPLAYYLIDDVTVIDADSMQGINDFENFNFSIYPNPATDKIKITTQPNCFIEEVEIFSVTGEMVFERKQQKEFDIGHLSKGVYIARIQTNKGMSYKKLIIQ